MQKVALALRLAGVPAVWLAFIPYAIAAGHNPGFVPPNALRPYPTGQVVAVCALMAIESACLFAMLEPYAYALRDWRRPLKVLGLVLLAFFLEPMVTDMPGYTYVNGAFFIVWSAILALLVVLGLLTSRMSRSPATGS